LAAVRHRQGRLIGRTESVGFERRNEAVLATLTGDEIKSSEIEGEYLNREQVRSSIARRLGMDIAGAVHSEAQYRRRCRVDARCHAALSTTADRRTPVRLARCAIPNWTQRNVTHHCRRLATGQGRPDAGRLRHLRPRKGALSGTGSRNGLPEKWTRSLHGSKAQPTATQ
jgi:Fic family protein